MQIKISNTEEYVDVVSTTIIGDSNNYTIVYETKHRYVNAEEIEDVVDSGNLHRTLVVLENMIKNNKYIKFDIVLK